MDEVMFRRFVSEHYGRLVAGIGMMLGSRAAAEDAVQEALARAWERSQRGDEIHSLQAWVTTVATNLARSKLRRRVTKRSAVQRLLTATDAPATDVDGRLDVRRALTKLPARQWEVTVLHYYLDLPLAEIGSVLGISEGTVKNALFRARRTLAHELRIEEELNDA